MHASLFVTAMTAVVPAAAWPGMISSASDAAAHSSRHARFYNTDMYKEIARAAAAAQVEEKQANARSLNLLGDLLHLADDALSDTGKTIKQILAGDLDAHAPPSSHGHHKSTTAETAPTSSSTSPASCSVWAQVGRAIQPAFRDSNGTGAGCSALARGAIRLGFHDAGAWNTSVGWGGADGSILLNATELARTENAGLADVVQQMLAWHSAWASQGVGMADLIQFAAIVATATCPLGPRIRFFAGRVDDTRAAAEGLLPSPLDSAAALVALFEAKTFTAADLVALVGAHSTSQQFSVDTAAAGEPQDSTPGVWDTRFYAETAQQTAPAGVFRFPSDVALAGDGATAGVWRTMINQGRWNAAYASAYFRMSLLGVDDINEMVDCTASLP